MTGVHHKIILLALIGPVLAASDRKDWHRVLASPDIPVTSFTCAGKHFGYYADVEAKCQVYHMCGSGGRQYSYLCPNTTLFHQRMLICAHWYQVNCSRSHQDYTANLLIGQRNKPFIDEPLSSGKQVYRLKDTDELQKLNPPVGPSPLENHHRHNDGSSNYNQEYTTKPAYRARKVESVRPVLQRAQVEPRHQTSTEPSPKFGPTNVSFRSTIDTPYLEPGLARTVPMTTSARTSSDFGGRRHWDHGVTEPSNPILPAPPSDLLPPLADDSRTEGTNTIELRLQDPRRSFYIPDSDSAEVPDGEIVVNIPVKGESSRFKPTYFRKEVLTECKRCHPMFVIDKKNCTPCLLVR